MRGRSKDPSPKRSGGGVLGSNQDIKTIINQKIKNDSNRMAIRDYQQRRQSRQETQNDENRKPNSMNMIVRVNNKNSGGGVK